MNSKNKGLGRGFDALLPQNEVDSALLIGEHERVHKLELNKLLANPDQPRKHFSEDDINELSSSIKRHGVLQPLVVTPDGDQYKIIAGERRFRAAKKAGLKEVPAIVRSSKELEQLEIALVENVQRVDLSPLEQGMSIVRLREQFNLDESSIANRLGKAKSTISNLARLVSLPSNAKKALSDGKINEGHARAILALKSTKDQSDLLSQIIRNGWNVRQAERYVNAKKAGITDKKTAKKHVSTSTPETIKLGKKLKSNVSIKRTAKGGKLEISFSDDNDLERLVKLLNN